MNSKFKAGDKVVFKDSYLKETYSIVDIGYGDSVWFHNSYGVLCRIPQCFLERVEKVPNNFIGKIISVEEACKKVVEDNAQRFEKRFSFSIKISGSGTSVQSNASEKTEAEIMDMLSKMFTMFKEVI